MFKKTLFLVISAAATIGTTLATPNSSERTHRRAPHPEDLIPSDHDVELNRDFTNMIQYGMIEGMFKIKMSGTPDCTDEGMTMFRAIGRLADRMEFYPEE